MIIISGNFKKRKKSGAGITIVPLSKSIQEHRYNCHCTYHYNPVYHIQKGLFDSNLTWGIKFIVFSDDSIHYYRSNYMHIIYSNHYVYQGYFQGLLKHGYGRYLKPINIDVDTQSNKYTLPSIKLNSLLEILNLVDKHMIPPSHYSIDSIIKHVYTVLKEFSTKVVYLSSYTGNWMNDNKHGYGIASYTSTLVPITVNYEGEWMNNLMNGMGLMQITYRSENPLIIFLMSLYKENNNFGNAVIYLPTRALDENLESTNSLSTKFCKSYGPF